MAMNVAPEPLSLRGAKYESRSEPPTSFYANTLRKHLLHRSGGALLHRRQHVRVGVERDGYGCMPQHLRDDLEIDVLR